MEKQIIARGAEAVLYLEKTRDGKALVKDRIKKGYRLPELDEKIRSQRTRREESLLARARRAGVAVPMILDSSDSTISMEYIEGDRIKDMLNSVQKNKRNSVYKLIGSAVAGLHSAGIVHGDLTTSNMVLKKGKLYMIDFGLGKFSKKTEDQATDLYVLLEALKSTHFRYMEEAWGMILNVYKQNYPNANEVFKRIEKIRHRRRYMGE
jgi:TP53 regulating kinase-like protein